MPQIIQPAAYYSHFGLVRIFMKLKKPDITGQTSVITTTCNFKMEAFTQYENKVKAFFRQQANNQQ